MNRIVEPKYQGYCIMCGTPTTHGVHHFIFGSSRQKADEDGIYADICDRCHTLGKEAIHGNCAAEKLSKMFGESVWRALFMEEHKTDLKTARGAFRARYGRNYY